MSTLQRSIFVSLVGGLLFTQALVAAQSKGSPVSSLSVAQIVERHIAARGGLTAWRAVQTLAVTGKVEAGAGDSLARSRKIALQGGGGRAGAAAVQAREETHTQVAPRARGRRPDGRAGLRR